MSEVSEAVKKDKLKGPGIQYFLVPFLVLLLLFFLMTYMAIRNRVIERYHSFETDAISIAESYSHALVYSRDAHFIITELLNQRLMLAIQAISMIEDKYDNDALSVIGDRFLLDEIYLYNSEGEIIYSKDLKYLGWKAHEGHPVHNFMVGDQEILVEDIRKDSESDNYLKYAYLRNEDGSFVQIGIMADTVYNFLRGFEINDLLIHLSNRSDILNAMFINNEFEIIASSLPEFTGRIMEEKEIEEHILKEDRHTVKTVFNGQNVFQVCAPVFHDGEKHGSLSLIWSAKELESEVRRMILEGVLMFIAVIITVGIILFYAYRKNKANIKIAYYDKLTGLPNSEYFVEYMKDEIKNSDNSKKAVMLINCRNFRTLNITYGFSYGDEILVQIAGRIKELIRPNDMLFKLGADRFLLVVDNYEKKEELNVLAEKIADIFENPIIGSVEHQYINIEIGIAEVKQDITVDKLLQEATLALDMINRNKSQHICYYEDIMDEQVMRQDRIEKTIRAVINSEDNHSLSLNFQPKWHANRNCLAGFEALARLNVEGLGNIPPAEFIDIAEKKMLMYDLGKVILRKACRFLNKISDMGNEDIKLSVNISVIQLLRDEFVKDVLEIVESSGIDKKSLVLEITESVIMDNFDLINGKLKAIKKAGILVSLDDFGTGFSSLSRLHELKIDYVKIDKYFVDKIIDQDEKKLIIADIISMSHKFGLTVVAEGVEKEEQKIYLKKSNCDILQGYLISKPLDEARAIEFIDAE